MRQRRARGPLALRYEGTAKTKESRNGPSGWQGSGLQAWLVRRCSRVAEAQERASVESTIAHPRPRSSVRQGWRVNGHLSR